jgi:basic amino acid/polyamine antiporter, APA family
MRTLAGKADGMDLKFSDASQQSEVGVLPREIGILGSTAIVVGTIIGSGIFLVPHNVAQQVGSVFSLYLVWIVGGALALAGALSLAELGAAMPEAGGIYVYLREAYGKLFAFLYGWGSLLVIDAGSAATLAAAFGIYASAFFPLTSIEQKVLGAVVIGILTLVNILGVRKGTAVQTIFTIAKLGGLAIIIGCAVFLPLTHALAVHPLPTPHTTLSTFGVALVGVLWAYQGWHQLSYTAGEVKNPSRVLPIGFFLGTSIIVVVYLAANAAYLHVLPLPVLAEHQRVAATAMQFLIGPRGARFVSALILCSIFGALNGTILTAPRVYYAMAKDGVFFRVVSRVHPKFQTPAVALIVLGAWSTLLAVSGSFEQLYTYVIFAMWIFSAAAIAGVIILRRRLPRLHRPYLVWGYPFLPIAFIIASLAIVANTLITKPLESVLGLGIILGGIPLYFVWRHFSEAAQSEG